MPAQPAPNSEVSMYAEDHVVTAQTVTASGNSGALSGYGRTKNQVVQVVVGSIGGTSPSYTFVVEDSIDGVNFNQVAAFTAITANGTAVQRITTPVSDKLRVKWTVTGTTPTAVVDVYVSSQAMSL